MEQLRPTPKQSQFFTRINCRNVDINHKSHRCVNKNIFSFDIALIMNLFKSGLREGLALFFKLFTGPVTFNGRDVSGLIEQSWIEKCQPAPSLTFLHVI